MLLGKCEHNRQEIYECGKLGILAYIDNKTYISQKVVVDIGEYYYYNEKTKRMTVGMTKHIRAYFTKQIKTQTSEFVNVWLPELNIKFKAYVSEDRKMLISTI